MNFFRHFFFGVVLGAFNLISSVVNIYFLFQEKHNKYGSKSYKLALTLDF